MSEAMEQPLSTREQVEQIRIKAALSSNWAKTHGVDVLLDWISKLDRRIDAADVGHARVVDWAMENEIAAPPLDWKGLGEILHGTPSDSVAVEG